MNRYIFKIIALFAFSIISASTFAQMSGLSYTVSPLAQYNWFGDKSGIKDGLLAGGQIGFGFGQNIELGGSYMQGFNLQTDINRFRINIPEGMDTMYTQRDINLKRYGGELKLNLSRGALLPYLSIGTGIQDISIDSLGSNKQIYYTAGLGIKFSTANRYTIGLQALGTGYRANPSVSMLSNSDRELFGVNVADPENENIVNYALRASLVLYLGGRKPGDLSDLDKAYWDNFSGGFRGLSIPVEPTVLKMDFHEDLAFRDTWMAGGSAGINVGPLVGIRGFYWRAMADGSATEFDHLAMYGAEARFKLNEGKGFTPWITLGGGQLNVGDDYIGSESTGIVADKPFAMGGLGIDLPLSKYLKITGFVRSILLTTQNAADVYQPEDLKNSISYGASVNFILGKSKNVDKVQKNVYDDFMEIANAKNDSANAVLQAKYDQKIMDLEKQLSIAIEEENIEAVKAISEEKAMAEEVKATLESATSTQSTPAPIQTPVPTQAPSIYSPEIINNPGASQIRMTPAEFQLLLREILDGVKKNDVGNGQSPTSYAPSASSMDDAISDLKTEQKIDDLKEAIADLKSDNSEMSGDLKDLVDSYDNKISDLNRELDKQGNRYEDLLENQSRIESGLAGADGKVGKVGKVVIESIESKKIAGDIEDTNVRIDELQQTILSTFKDFKSDLDEGKYAGNNSDNSDNKEDDSKETASKNSKRNKNMNKDMGLNDRRDQKGQKEKKFQDVNLSNRNNVSASDEYNARDGFFGKLRYTGMSGFAGFGVGGSATFNIGYRLHYALGGSSKLEFMPETFFGLGSPSSFGIMANMTYALPIFKEVEIIKPYVGLGLGLMKVSNDTDEDKLKGAYNFIVGSYLNVWKGDLYVDYTARNLFKYNQLIVGYRFPF